MSPVEAVCASMLKDTLDTAEIREAQKRRLAVREEYRRSRVARAAALLLCAERGHGRELRGCQMCRDDVAAVKW